MPATDPEDAMSARDFFVVDEEHKARVQAEDVSWTGERSDAAGALSLAVGKEAAGKELGCADQLGKEETLLLFLVKHILPFLVIGLLLLLALAGDGASANDIPSPCRG
ncbi:MAG TPA: hypothetical protein VF800_18405 [Telluria sp.]